MLELQEICIHVDDDGEASVEFMFDGRRLIFGTDNGREFWAIASLPSIGHDADGSGYVDEGVSLADAFFRALKTERGKR